MENINSDRIAEYRRNKMFIVIIITVLYFFYDLLVPLVSGRPSGGQFITFIATLLFGFLILLWCSVDSAENDEPLENGWNIAIVVFGVLALIIYLFKTRGLRRGVVSFGWLLLFLLFLVLISLLNSLVFSAIYLPS